MSPPLFAQRRKKNDFFLSLSLFSFFYFSLSSYSLQKRGTREVPPLGSETSSLYRGWDGGRAGFSLHSAGAAATATAAAALFSTSSSASASSALAPAAAPFPSAALALPSPADHDVERRRRRRGMMSALACWGGGGGGRPGKRRAPRRAERRKRRSGSRLGAPLSCSSFASRSCPAAPAGRGLFDVDDGEERVPVGHEPAQSDEAHLVRGRGGLGGERAVCFFFEGFFFSVPRSNDEKWTNGNEEKSSHFSFSSLRYGLNPTSMASCELSHLLQQRLTRCYEGRTRRRNS